MSDDRRHPERPEGREPLVTYSRVEPRPTRKPRRVARPERAEPHITAVEVPWTDDFGVADEPELRAVPFELSEGADLGLDPLMPPRKPRTLRYLLLAGVAAIVLGAGLLFGVFTTASVAPTTAPATADLTPAAPQPTADADAIGGGTGVREISLTDHDGSAATDGADAAAAAVVPAEPPVPRPRPERATAALPAPDATVSDGPDDTAPLPDVPVASAPAPDATADGDADEAEFISRIERTLATLPAEPSASANTPALTGTLPPDAAPAAVAAPPPVADTAAPALSGSQDEVPLDWSPTVEAPLAPDTAGTTAFPAPPQGVPVPPEDIPNVSGAGAGLQ